MFIKMRQCCFPRACLQQLHAVLELLILPGPYSPQGDEMGKMLEDGQGGQRPLVPAPWHGLEVLKCKHLVSKEITTTHAPKQAQRCAALWDQQPAIPFFKESKLASPQTSAEAPGDSENTIDAHAHRPKPVARPLSLFASQQEEVCHQQMQWAGRGGEWNGIKKKKKASETIQKGDFIFITLEPGVSAPVQLWYTINQQSCYSVWKPRLQWH